MPIKRLPLPSTPKSASKSAPKSAPKIGNLSEATGGVAQSLTPPKPYGALAMHATPENPDAAIPFYGDGFKGWVRKTWADLTDPDKYFKDADKLTDVQQTYYRSEYEANVKKAGEMVEKSKWSDWAENFFGLTSEEMGRQLANVDIEQKIAGETGQSKVLTAASQFLRIARDTGQNILWGGLELISLDDTAMRKINSTFAGIDAIADRYNQDTQDTWLKKLFSQGSIGVSKDLFTIASAVQKNKTSWGEVWKETGKYRAASDMAYSMIWDEYARAEFEKGIAEGKDPELLAQSLGRAGIELLGSIAGSPSTYLGLNIKSPVSLTKWWKGQAGDVVTTGVLTFSHTFNVPWRTVARIPSFGDMLYKFGGVKIGQMYRTEKGLALFADVPKELEELFLKEAGKAADEKRASRVLKLLSEETVRKFNQMTRGNGVDEAGKAIPGGFGIFSLDQSGKVDVVSKHATLLINAINGEISKGRVDTSLQILRNLIIQRNGGPEGVQAAAELWATGHGKILFSSTGRMLGEILSRMADASVEKIVAKHAGDPLTLATELTSLITRTVDDIVPSVDSMYAAVLKKEADKIAGIASDARTLKYAEMYEQVPWLIKKITKATRIPEAVVGVTSKTMAFTFMHLVPRAFARNIEGQGLLTAIHVGLGTALQASINSLGGLNKNLTRKIVNSKELLLMERTGMVSSKAATGVGKMIPREIKIFGKTIPGLLPSINRAESVYKTEIIFNKSSEYILQQLPNAARGLPEWDAVIAKLDKDKQGLLFAAMNRNYGNYDKAMDTFRGWFKDGNIRVRHLVEPNQYLKKELDSMGLMDGLYELQQTAKTPEEFTKAVDAFVKDYKKGVLEEAAKLPWVASAGDELSELALSLEKYGDKETQNMMNGLIQAWQNVKKQTVDVVNTSVEAMDKRASARDDALEIQKAVNRLAPVKYKIYRALDDLTYENTNKLREEINIINDFLKTDEVTVEALNKIWKEPFVGINKSEMFTLSKIYPDIDMDSLSPQKLRKLAWEAYYEYKATSWYRRNTQAYRETLDYLNEGAEAVGSSYDEMASQLTGMDNPYRAMEQLNLKAYELEQVFAFKRMFKNLQVTDENMTLVDAIAEYKKTFPDFIGDEKFVGTNSYWDAKKVIKQKIMVSPYAGTLPNPARAKFEGLDGLLDDVKEWKNEIVNSWDVTVPTPSLNIEKELRALKPAWEKRMGTVRIEAMATGEAYADFLLHDYNKTYADHALSYLLGNSFHYWTTRTYRNALETVISEPKWANAYLSLKDYNQKRHSELPEWMRNSLVIPGDGNNQYIINLESMINPLYNLTNVDFNDPRKEVDSVSRMVSDLNKLGPSFSPLVSWAVALHLYNKNEKEASQRWLGRMFPQTSTIKTISNAFGKPVELDPFALTMEGNVTPYERNHVAAALGLMVQKKMINPETGLPLTQEEAMEASVRKEGQLWNIAVSTALDKRWAGELGSFFLGAGMRVRTQDDVMIDNFWNKYHLLVTSRNMMSADDYSAGFDKLREEFPFSDVMLFSRRAGEEQLAAMTYNVMSRIQPGQSADLAELVGIKPYMLDSFYENKGDFDKMGLNDQDRARFEAGVVDLSLILAMPDGATEQEWDLAKREYRKMVAEMNAAFGVDIQKKMYADYYESPDKEAYLEMNPDVGMAFDFKNKYIQQSPILTTYYGGLEVVNRYYDGQVYDELEKMFGDMSDEFARYKELQLIAPSEAAKYKKIHLDWYYRKQNELYKEADRKIQEIAPTIPNPMPYTLRPEFQPMSGIQQDVRTTAIGTPGITWADWQQELSPALQNEIMKTVASGGELKYSAMNQLKTVAEQKFNMSGYKAWRQIQILLRK